MARTTPLLALTLLALSGCRGPTRDVTFEVSRHNRPLPVARVYAIALDTSDVPLPVTSENLNKAISAIAAGGVTDEHGRVRLTLDAGSPYWIDVAGALGAPEAAGSWVLDVTGDALEPAERKDPDLQLRVVR